MKAWALFATLVALLIACASTPPRPPESSELWKPSSTPVVLREPNCQVVAPNRRAKNWAGELPEVGTAHVDGMAIPLRYLDGGSESVPPFSGIGTRACRNASRFTPEKFRSFVVTEGDACFIGVLESEVSQGRFTIVEGGHKAFSVALDSPELLLRLQGRLLLIWHYSDRIEWGISRVLRDAAGRWRLEPAIQRGGHLRGYAFDPQGRLLLRVWDDNPEWCGTRWRLYRLLEDGRLEVLG